MLRNRSTMQKKIAHFNQLPNIIQNNKALPVQHYNSFRSAAILLNKNALFSFKHAENGLQIPPETSPF